LRFEEVNSVKVGFVERAVVAVTAEGAVEAVLLRLTMGSVLRASPASLRSHRNCNVSGGLNGMLLGKHEDYLVRRKMTITSCTPPLTLMTKLLLIVPSS